MLDGCQVCALLVALLAGVLLEVVPVVLLLAGVLILVNQVATQHLDLWVLLPSCGLLVGGS